jgi:hypothetical protein
MSEKKEKVVSPAVNYSLETNSRRVVGISVGALRQSQTSRLDRVIYDPIQECFCTFEAKLSVGGSFPRSYPATAAV